jgi:ketosteroid isomerase-like protein
MIGAILTKKLSGASYDAFNRRDLKGVMANWAEDAVYTFPGSISISGETKGKKAIEAVQAKMMEHYPKMVFTVKKCVYFQYICPRCNKQHCGGV